MNSAASQPASLAQAPGSALSRLAHRAAAAVSGSVLVALCAHIAIPLWFTPVPLTMQTFAVLLLGLLLDPGTAASALALYLLEGMAGLPVFSPIGSAGFLHLMGPTAGYLLAYPAAAALTSGLRRRIGADDFLPSLAAATAGSGLILLAGAAWLAVLTHKSAGAILALSVAPFLPGDILKMIAAAGAAAGFRRLRRS